jgi:transposase
MEQILGSETPKISRAEALSKEELIQRNEILEFEVGELIQEVYRLRNQKITASQAKLLMEEQLGSLKDALYGASSERYKKPQKDKPKKDPKPRVKKPSERYPNVPVRDVVIAMDPIPECEACGKVMSDSGMYEESEQLTVIPKKYEILRQLRVKYRCQCQGCIQTAPVPARMVEGSSYSDDMILDVVLSKYCDLIPIDRYTKMAARAGLVGLPGHSLIEATHACANFVLPAYALIRDEVLKSRILHADETPHNMLEGSERKSWYLWGFSTENLCFLECHNTRSGDVASDILLESACEILVTDVYAGYGKAVRLANQA